MQERKAAFPQTFRVSARAHGILITRFAYSSAKSVSAARIRNTCPVQSSTVSAPSERTSSTCTDVPAGISIFPTISCVLSSVSVTTREIRIRTERGQVVLWREIS